MQHTQQYYAKLRRAFFALALGYSALAAAPAPKDPILDDGGPTPCQAGADYAAGQDVAGNAVAPADLSGTKVPVPDNVAVPLKQRAGRQGRAQQQDFSQDAFQPTGQDSPYVSLDGKTLDPLLNPEPCN